MSGRWICVTNSLVNLVSFSYKEHTFVYKIDARAALLTRFGNMGVRMMTSLGAILRTRVEYETSLPLKPLSIPWSYSSHFNGISTSVTSLFLVLELSKISRSFISYGKHSTGHLTSPRES